MGESRASQLRQDTNADIIFSGAAGRRAADLCTVELGLANDGSKDLGMWGEYAELSIRREVDRDGESAYFINGQRVRRKDVVDVFAGTGVGARAYGIVEQERVTQVIRSEPKRIREHLEEAAGVSQYKERRRETESRIGVSQANLSRIDDTLAELRSQMSSLERQARQTEQVRKHKKRLAAARLLSLAMRHEELSGGSEAAGAEAAAARKAEEEVKARHRKVEGDLEKVRRRRQERAESLNALQGGHFAALADQEKARQALRDFESGVAADEAALKDADAAVEELTAKVAEHEAAVKAVGAEIKAGERAQKEAARRIAASAKDRDDAAAELAASEEALDKARASLEGLRGAEAEAAAAANLARHRVESLDAAVAAAKEDLKALAPVEKPDGKRLEKLRRELAGAVEAAVANERRRQELGEGIAAAKEESARLQGIKGGLLAERDLLRRVSGQRTERYSSWLAGHGLEGSKRVIDEMDIKAPGLERAVDAALSVYLHGYVVPDVGRLLGSEELPAGMVVLDHKGSGDGAPGRRSVEGLSPLIDRIKFEDSWRDVIARWLDGVFLAPDLETALKARGKLRRGEMLVTPEGVCFQDCVARVAGDREAGLEWRSRLAEVEKGIAANDRGIESHAAKLESMSERHGKLAADGEGLAEVRRAAEEAFDGQNQEAIRLGHAQEYREKQARRLNETAEGARKERAERAAELAGAEKSQKAAAAKVRGAEEGLEGTEAAHARLAEKVSERRDASAALDNELHRLELTVEHNRQRLGEAKERLAEAKVSLSNARVKIVEVRARQRGRDGSVPQAALDKAAAAVEAAKKKLDEAADGADELEGEQSRLEGQIALLRSELEQAGESQRELEVAAATRRAEADGIKAQLDAQKDGLGEAEGLRKTHADADAVADLVGRLERRIDKAGPVNYAAEAELSACEARLEEASAQREDLAEALDALNEAIGRIDSEMHNRLKDVHSRLQVGFDAMFKRLFDGGEASVDLVGDSLLTAGLQLRATPPGKRTSTIQALSGGEKTLTAIAFLFALNELNPPRFCILDEVDAALDEANTVRLCRLIEGMADRMQFIIITHNKQVIERADRLIGVTQHNKGVSSLVTVQVEQALEHARRASAGGGR